MVWELKCDCCERIGLEINSIKVFEKLRDFFNDQVQMGIFIEVEVVAPYYVWVSEEQNNVVEWYATKWYKCKSCDCLWEFQYPDFPAKGFVRKFENGLYRRDN